MSRSPWKALPEEGWFIHPDDETIVRDFNRLRRDDHDHFLHFDIVPEAFIGRPDAPLVLLSNNPGYVGGNNDQERRRADFMIKMRRNLLHESLDCPFVFLDPMLKGSYGQKWWRSKLRDLIEDLGVEVVARSILNVTYFPYASRRFGHWQVEVPTARYNFQLVREAIERKATIVRMRTGRHLWQLWLKSVPELYGYPKLIRVKNPQAATLNRTNLDESSYELILDSIEKADEAGFLDRGETHGQGHATARGQKTKQAGELKL